MTAFKHQELIAVFLAAALNQFVLFRKRVRRVGLLHFNDQNATTHKTHGEIRRVEAHISGGRLECIPCRTDLSSSHFHRPRLLAKADDSRIKF
ncbi:hypothetical protein FQZ97_1191450 [compost metagenome]